MVESKGAFGENGKKPHRYPTETRSQAIELYNGCQSEYRSNEKAAKHTACLLGIGSYDSVLSWAGQYKIDSDCSQGLGALWKYQTEYAKQLNYTACKLETSNTPQRTSATCY